MKIFLTPKDDLDKALASNREPDTEFYLEKGIYKTKGNWYYKDYRNLADNCKIYGNNSTIILDIDAVKVTNGALRPNRDLNVLWCGANTYIQDLIIDGNESVFVDASDQSKTWFVTSGVRAFGKVTLKNVIVQKIRGTHSAIGTQIKNIESFGISSVGSDGGSLIENCSVVDCPGTSYISSFLIGHLGSNIARSFVVNCKTNVGKGNWAAFTPNLNVTFDNCESVGGSMIAIYNDTGNVENTVIENCKFNNVDKLISFVIPNGKNDFKKNIKIKNCEVIYSAGNQKHLVEFWDQNVSVDKRQIGPLLIQNLNVIKDSTSKLYVACVGAGIRPISIIDSNIPGQIEDLSNNTLSIF